MYGICPLEAAALKTDLVPDELVSRLVQSVERETAVFDLNYHMMNVRDLLKEGTPVSTDPWQGMMGMNGGYYGAGGRYLRRFPVRRPHADRAVCQWFC